MKRIAGAFRKNPRCGAVTSAPLGHWQALLEEWCKVHARYCELVADDAIYWHIERSNLAALAAAAWRIDWAALEEFSHEKVRPNGRFSGRADLLIRSPMAEEYIEAKLAWCRHATDERVAMAVSALEQACVDAAAVQLPAATAAHRWYRLHRPECPVR